MLFEISELKLVSTNDCREEDDEGKNKIYNRSENNMRNTDNNVGEQDMYVIG